MIYGCGRLCFTGRKGPDHHDGYVTRTLDNFTSLVVSDKRFVKVNQTRMYGSCVVLHTLVKMVI